jgi:hypothetical protein
METGGGEETAGGIGRAYVHDYGAVAEKRIDGGQILKQEVTDYQGHVSNGPNDAEDSGECVHSALPAAGNQNGPGNEGGDGSGEPRIGGDSGRSSADTSQARREAHERRNPNQRTLSLAKSDNVEQIWRWAEERLRADRANFTLVFVGCKYLPQEGKLDAPAQLFEIRWRGFGGDNGDRPTSDQGETQMEGQT